MKLKKLPIGQSSFRNIIERNQLYIDKTKYIYELITNTQFNFLSRPRRFGKSLLISTLEEIFKGNKELFRGLWIYHSDYEWDVHPVLIFDFNGISDETPELLLKSIDENLNKKGAFFDIQVNGVSIKEKFIDLVNKIYEKEGRSVVILIDEYDKPIISHLGMGEDGIDIAKQNREILKSFYGTIKEYSVIEKLRFVLLTGVSKFSKAGVFSELNNLSDLTMDARSCAILGVTDEEIDIYMKDHIEAFAEIIGKNYDGIREELKSYYNGYRFSDSSVKVYNPFSLVNFLDKKKFSNYWFESGTPTFLINLIKERDYYLPQAEEFESDDTLFSTYDLENLDITALLFQTGYLTIKNYDREFNLYKLTYPNREVKDSFLKYIYVTAISNKSDNLYNKIAVLLSKGEVDEFISVVETIFASITYEEGSRLNEANFHTLFYVILSAGSVPARSQVLNYMGRIDMVVEIKNKVYIFEFKCNQRVEAAIEQIKKNEYYKGYLHQDKEIYLIGINFDSNKRNISEYFVERV